MKFLSPILFVGAAAASTNFTLWISGGDDESSRYGPAAVFPHTDPDAAPSVGFSDEDFPAAVLSLDDDGVLEQGFVLQFQAPGVWGLVANSTARDTDLLGPFEIDDTTGDFRYTGSAGAGDLAWAFCHRAEGALGEADIYLRDDSVPEGSCLSPHELMART
ncbi:hypothetical protein B0J18DRAFT_413761 [Chaetomium sp. MPI-SDFR-AT-0129]|nr:hypothetical protein B0J18DRAFT_413761 [Chaetomium sp. MPI-SDFR-AT-0129]